MLKGLFTVSEHLWYQVRGQIHARIKSERGAVSAEYAILVVFIALVIIVGATALGIAINNKLNDAATTIDGAGGGGGGEE
jgi:pilus assembly protein Flp/PilA